MVLLFEHLVVAVPHHLLLPALDAQLDYPAHLDSAPDQVLQVLLLVGELEGVVHAL